jgi:tetratricopeptide (TPR) repeat protein
MERVIVWHRWSPPAEPSREAMAFALGWRDLSRERFLGADGELLVELGGSAVFALPANKLARAIDLCLSAVRDVEREETNAGGLSFGLAIGNVGRVPAEDGSWVGDALDRAQALANAAGAHEVLLDANAHASASHLYLFAREIQAGASVGMVVDRAFPRRAECARALVHLQKPPFAAEGQAQFEALRRLAKSPGRHRVLLVGAHGSGIGQWITRIAAELAPPAWIDVRALGASLAPLSGLMYALRRLPPEAAPEQVLLGEDSAALQALVAIRSGRGVGRREAVLALRQYVMRCAVGGQRALISVDPTAAIDPGTIGVIAETARDHGPDLLLIMRLLVDAKPPEALRGGLTEVRVRGLSAMEARTVAAAMLGDEQPSDIARRAAAMGGSSPQAVAEAMRVLVASGDVVWENNKFRWRRGPAGRLNTLDLETLLEERFDALAAPLRRALEVLATVPDADDRSLCAEVAAADGLLEETFARAVEELDRLGLARADARGTAVSETMRMVAHAAMTPARALELHRNVAQALGARIGAEQEFAGATQAYFLARAGNVTEAAELFLDVAARAGHHGFVRSGVRLAAAAVEADNSENTRARAAAIAERLSERQLAPKPSHHTGTGPLVPRKEDLPRRPSIDVVTQARTRAVQAILARDFDEVERAVELLVAAGRDGASVDRLRAVTLLVKGDRDGASLLLARLHEGNGAGESPRLLLTQALLSIASEELTAAVRTGLRALSLARQARDGVGERACLSVLSLCYGALGRKSEAQQLASAALAPDGAARAHA